MVQTLITKSGNYTNESIYKFLDPHGKILDIGCGWGRHSLYFAKRGLHVVGIDISSESLEKLRSQNLDIEVYKSDACSLPFNENEFDYILCSELLEHLANPDLCIKEAYRVLKNGGIALFTTPCLNLPFNKLVPLSRRLRRLPPSAYEGHIQIFNTFRLLKMMKKYFIVVDVKHVGFLELIERLLGIGYSFDAILSNLAYSIWPLRLFASGVWIKVRKNPE